MKDKKKDKFLSDLLGYPSYNINSKNEINHFRKIDNNFLLILKTSNHLRTEDCKNFYIKMRSKLIIFKKKILKNNKFDFECRFARKKDIKSIIKICKENPYGSRFEKDPLISHKFLMNYRSIWLKNFFKKKRGDYLIIAKKKNIILGFLLLIKENQNLRIDQILVGNKFKRMGVAKTLINYTSNYFSNNHKVIIAGTYDHNLTAKKLYKKLNFKREKKIKYIYHLYPKNCN